jgi:hypothetical protein
MMKFGIMTVEYKNYHSVVFARKWIIVLAHAPLRSRVKHFCHKRMAIKRQIAD